MNEKNHEWIQLLESEWSKPDGFLGQVREGVFDYKRGAAFLEMLESIKLAEYSTIDRRLVALLWYIPNFLRWQKERVMEKGGNAVVYEQLSNKVQGIVEGILGVP